LGGTRNLGPFCPHSPDLRHSSLLEDEQYKERKKERVSQTCTGETSENSKRRKELRKFRKGSR